MHVVRRIFSHVVMFSLALLHHAACLADEPWFVGYAEGQRLFAISGDGSVAGGSSLDPNGALWVPLPDPPLLFETGEVQAFVPDGSLGVGRVSGPGGLQPARWHPDGTFDALGVGPLFDATALAVSHDGDTLTGFGLSPDGLSAFVWTNAAGYTVLEQLAGRDRHTAHAISADGTKIFGRSSISTEPVSDAVCWTRGEGGWTLSVIDGLLVANDCSADGSIVVGESDDGKPARWEAGRITRIGLDGLDGRAGACTVDGTVVVGNSVVDGTSRPWIWRSGCGAESLADILADLDFASGWTFEVGLIRDVADDGRTFAGFGQAPGGSPFIAEGFVLHLGDVINAGDVNDDGVADFTDLLAVLSGWGPCVGCPEDLDGDDAVGFADLLLVLSNWGPCD